MFTYLNDGVTHSDCSVGYMTDLGLDDDAQRSITEQLNMYIANTANKENEWAASELALADIEISKINDGDPRASLTVEQWRSYRMALRDHVKSGVISPARPVNPLSSDMR